MSQFLPPLSMAALVLFAAATPAISSCGGSTEAQPDGAPPLVVDEESFDHSLKIKVEGVAYEARGRPFGPAMIFSGPEVNVQVGGPLRTAVESGKSVSLGDFDMLMNVYTNGLEPGDYELRANRSSVSRVDDEKRGFAEVFFRAEAPFKHLEPVSGTLTVDSVDGRAEGKSFRMERVRGRVEGTFRDEASVEHEISGSFDYRR